MSKFEIVNQTWIKQVKFFKKDSPYVFAAIKIEDICYWSVTHWFSEGKENYSIFISSHNSNIELTYIATEFRIFTEDLLFLKKLLFNSTD